MDLRGIIHPRHAGLLTMLPVNSGQPHIFKEQYKGIKLNAKPRTIGHYGNNI